MLKFCICDNNEQDSSFLKQQLENYLSKRYGAWHIYQYKDGSALVDDYEDGSFRADMIFLDMPEPHSLRIAERIRKLDTFVKIVFTSTSREFAVECFEVDAFSYLAKPIETARLSRVLDKFFAKIKERQQKSLLVKNKNCYDRIPYKDIIYIESKNTSIYVHLQNGKSIRLYMKLGDIEKELRDRSFVRCHQSYIVNMESVESIKNDFILRDGTHIPIRRQDRKQMRTLLYEYIVNDEEF